MIVIEGKHAKISWKKYHFDILIFVIYLWEAFETIPHAERHLHICFGVVILCPDRKNRRIFASSN